MILYCPLNKCTQITCDLQSYLLTHGKFTLFKLFTIHSKFLDLWIRGLELFKCISRPLVLELLELDDLRAGEYFWQLFLYIAMVQDNVAPVLSALRGIQWYLPRSKKLTFWSFEFTYKKWEKPHKKVLTDFQSIPNEKLFNFLTTKEMFY